MYNTLYPHSWGISALGFIGLGIVGVIIFIIVFVLKGLALWHAARRSEKWWFIILLVVNTIGILELIYLFFVVGLWHKFQKPNTPTSTPSDTTPTV